MNAPDKLDKLFENRLEGEVAQQIEPGEKWWGSDGVNETPDEDG